MTGRPPVTAPRGALPVPALLLPAVLAAALTGCGGSDHPGPDAAWSGPAVTSPSPAASSATVTTTRAATTRPSRTTSRTRTRATARTATPAGGRVALPPRDVRADYQIGGAYRPPSGTRLVVRDRGAAPLKGVYSVCYVNAYQAQPHELAWWRSTHSSLLLRDSAGAEVIDPDWDEALLDISTDAKRRAIAKILGGWFAGCARAGFQAVEPDNLDSWTRSRGRLDSSDTLAMARLVAAEAHRHGLAVAQKNTAELSTRLRAAGYDFAVAEECTRYAECGSYTRAYGDRVLVVEYRQADLDAACASSAIGGRLSVVLRDVDVSTPGSSGYRYASC